MVYRSSISCLMLLVYLNKNIKFIMVDDVDKKSMPALAIRTITGNFAIFVNFMSAKYFPLTLVAMIINAAPLVTMLLAGPILGEKVTLSAWISLFSAFIAIGLVILGGKTPEDAPVTAYTPTLFAYIALIFNPLCISAGGIAMRAMRKLNDNVVSCYMALALLVIFTPICLINDFDLTIWYRFNITDWVCLVGISGGTILS